MNLQKIRRSAKWFTYCQVVVVGGFFLGGLLFLSGRAFGIGQDDFWELPVLRHLLLPLTLIWFLSFAAMMKFYNDIDPKAQLRGKSKNELLDVLECKELEGWHPMALDRLKKIEAKEEANKAP